MKSGNKKQHLPRPQEGKQQPPWGSVARASALHGFEDAVPDRHSDWASSTAAFCTIRLKHFQLLKESFWERD